MAEFDASASAAARDVAIDRAEAAANEAWMEAALQVVERVCKIRDEFTTDAVWALLDRAKLAAPREPRAMGAVMRRAVGAGLCMPTERTSNSVRVDCHRRPVRVWRSRLRGQIR